MAFPNVPISTYSISFFKAGPLYPPINNALVLLAHAATLTRLSVRLPKSIALHFEARV